MPAILLAVDTDPAKAATGFRALARALADSGAGATALRTAIGGLGAELDGIAGAAGRVQSTMGGMAQAITDAKTAFQSLNRNIANTADYLTRIAAATEQVHIGLSGAGQEIRNNATLVDLLGKSYRDLATSMRLPSARLPGLSGGPGQGPIPTGQGGGGGGNQQYSMAANFLKYQVGYAAISDVTQAIKDGFTQNLAESRAVYATQATTGITDTGRQAIQQWIATTGSKGVTSTVNGVAQRVAEPYTTDQLAQIAYPVASAGVTNPTAVTGISDWAVKAAAQGGKLDPGPFALALAQVMSNSGLNQNQMAQQFQRYGDALVMLMNKGNLSPEAAAANVSKFSGVASTFGVGLNTSLGLYATLSQHGAPEDEAQSLRALLTGVGAPGHKAQLAARDLQVQDLFGQSGTKMLSDDPQQWLQKLQYATRADPMRDLLQLFPNKIAALGAANAIADIPATTATIKAIGTPNATDVGLAKYNQSPAAQFDDSTARFKDSVADFTKAALPLARALTDSGTGLLKGLSDVLNGPGGRGGIDASIEGAGRTVVDFLNPFGGTFFDKGASQRKAGQEMAADWFNQDHPGPPPPPPSTRVVAAESQEQRNLDAIRHAGQRPAAPPVVGAPLPRVPDTPAYTSPLDPTAPLNPYSDTAGGSRNPYYPAVPLVPPQLGAEQRYAAHLAAQRAAQQRAFEGRRGQLPAPEESTTGTAAVGGIMSWLNPGQAALDARTGLTKPQGPAEVRQMEARLQLAMAQGKGKDTIASALGMVIQAIQEDNSGSMSAVDKANAVLAQRQAAAGYLAGRDQAGQNKVLGRDQAAVNLAQQQLQTAQTAGADPREIARLDNALLDAQQKYYDDLDKKNKPALKAATDSINAARAQVGRTEAAALLAPQIAMAQNRVALDQASGAGSARTLADQMKVYALQRQQILRTEPDTPGSNRNIDLAGLHTTVVGAQRQYDVQTAQANAQAQAATFGSLQQMGVDPETQRRAYNAYAEAQKRSIALMAPEQQGPARDALKYQTQAFNQGLASTTAQQQVDLASQRLQQAQALGANPAELARLENAYVTAQEQFYRTSTHDQGKLKQLVDAAEAGKRIFTLQNLALPQAQYTQSAAQERFATDQQLGAGPATLRRDEQAALNAQRATLNTQYPDHNNNTYKLGMQQVNDQQAVFNYQTRIQADQLVLTASQNMVAAAQSMNMAPDKLYALQMQVLNDERQLYKDQLKGPALATALKGVDLQGGVNNRQRLLGDYQRDERDLQNRLATDQAKGNFDAIAKDLADILSHHVHNMDIAGLLPSDISAEQAKNNASLTALQRTPSAPFTTPQQGITAETAGLDGTAVRFGGTQSAESREIAVLRQELAAANARADSYLARIAAATEARSQAGQGNSFAGLGHERSLKR